MHSILNKHSPRDVTQVMQLVIVGLLPGIAVFIYHTGWGGLLNLLIAVLAAVIFESLSLTLRRKDPGTAIKDYSAIVTGVLIALCVPPLLPWWITVLAVVFAIVLAKHCYGGLGQNIFNPAMAGYAIILISFPRELSLWPSLPDAFTTTLAETLTITFNGGLGLVLQWDALTGATALDKARDLSLQGKAILNIREQTHGLFGAINSEWLNLAYLLGGIGLIYKKIISWHIPASLLMAVFICSLLESLLAGPSPMNAGFHLFGGATMLCAFFIATDPVSAAASNRGRIIYGAGIGLLVYSIRTWGSYPDSIAFAVLLMNCLVPMIDRVEPHLWRRNNS